MLLSDTMVIEEVFLYEARLWLEIHRAERDVDAGIGGVLFLEEMNLHDSVVVEAERFAESVLGDLEAAVHVAAQRRGEVKADGQGQRAGAQGLEQSRSVRRPGKGNQGLLGHQRFVASPDGGEHAPPVDRGILVVDAGRDRQGQGQPVRRERGLCERSRSSRLYEARPRAGRSCRRNGPQGEPAWQAG